MTDLPFEKQEYQQTVTNENNCVYRMLPVQSKYSTYSTRRHWTENVASSKTKQNKWLYYPIYIFLKYISVTSFFVNNIWMLKGGDHRVPHDTIRDTWPTIPIISQYSVSVIINTVKDNHKTIYHDIWTIILYS